MTQYLLDANVLIDSLRDLRSKPAHRLRRERAEDVAISSIVVHELFYGAFRSQRVERNLALVERLQFAILDFDREDARQAGVIRAALAARGTQIGPYDVLTAGQASARGMVLVTHNTREFARVPGLQIEDWQT